MHLIIIICFIRRENALMSILYLTIYILCLMKQILKVTSLKTFNICKPIAKLRLYIGTSNLYFVIIHIFVFIGSKIVYIYIHYFTVLFRFCEIMKKSYHCPRPNTIMHYILPLANQFLCSTKYNAKNSLVDAAIDVRLFFYLT